MIVEITLCVMCIGSVVLYVAYVASNVTCDQDELLFRGRGHDYKPELLHYSEFNFWQQ